MPRVKKYLKSAICVAQGLFFTLHLAYKTAQERFRNYNPIVLGLKSLHCYIETFLPKILSEVT